MSKALPRLGLTTTTTVKEENDMSTDSELVEGELVPTVIDHPPTAATLFGTSDPSVALERMSDLAKVLIDVVRDRKLAVRIGGREHLTAEAWTTLGGMLGVVPVVAWTRRLDDGTGWEARVEARTLDGRLVGAAESMCSRSEQTWARRDEYALRSMAQTRAIGRALRAPLGQIVVLAGYEPAGAEEIPDNDESRSDDGPIPNAVKPTPEQLAQIRSLLNSLEGADPETDWPGRCREIIGVPSELMTRTTADGLIRKLEQELRHQVEQAR